MPSGSCFCGKIHVSFTGEPEAHALCHCLDCRKISGSTNSHNVVVPKSNFKLESGTPKTISKTSDAGRTITSHFCGDCGTTLFRSGDVYPSSIIIKAGILDDPKWPDQRVPNRELFTSSKVEWVAPIKGAAQTDRMS